MNKSFIKFITDFGPLLVFFSFYYKNEKNLIVAIPPFIVATIISLIVVWILEKKIPMGSGLGGGSSNAATTLKALNILWDCGFTNKQLSTKGTTLGADVPFFVLSEFYYINQLLVDLMFLILYMKLV